MELYPIYPIIYPIIPIIPYYTYYTCLGRFGTGFDRFGGRKGLKRLEKGLKKALAYLKEIQEIGWVEFEENNVYIGWKSIPGDFGMINRAAAAIGNNAIQFGTHFWSVKDDQKGWRPGDAPYYCATTARGGKVKDSSCK